MKISKKLNLQNIKIKSIFSPADSHANHFHMPDEEKARMIHAIYGRKCIGQFKKFSRHTLWQKMFSELLIGQMDWFSSKSLLKWNLKATKYKRILFQLQVSTPLTEDTEFGLLLTPTCMQVDENPNKTISRRNQKKYKNGTKYNTLTSQLKYKNLPTPLATEGYHYQKTLSKNGNQLTAELIHLTNSTNSLLSPRFVAEMMGFPPNWTELPFQNGERKVSKPTAMQ